MRVLNRIFIALTFLLVVLTGCGETDQILKAVDDIHAGQVYFEPYVRNPAGDIVLKELPGIMTRVSVTDDYIYTASDGVIYRYDLDGNLLKDKTIEFEQDNRRRELLRRDVIHADARYVYYMEERMAFAKVKQVFRYDLDTGEIIPIYSRGGHGDHGKLLGAVVIGDYIYMQMTPGYVTQEQYDLYREDVLRAYDRYDNSQTFYATHIPEADILLNHGHLFEWQEAGTGPKTAGAFKSHYQDDSLGSVLMRGLNHSYLSSDGKSVWVTSQFSPTEPGGGWKAAYQFDLDGNLTGNRIYFDDEQSRAWSGHFAFYNGNIYIKRNMVMECWSLK